MEVALVNFVPPARYSEAPWVTARIEEASNPAGPWALVESFELDPVDDDPEFPAPRSFSSELATLESGWYHVVWIDGDDEEAVSSAVLRTPIAYRPSVRDVAALLRARTKDDAGNELGNFTAATRPTGNEVLLLIEKAMGDIESRVGEEVPTKLINVAKDLAALRSAMYVELTYFPEQVQNNLSPYQEYKELWEEGIANLVTAAEAAGDEDVVTTGRPRWNSEPAWKLVW